MASSDLSLSAALAGLLPEKTEDSLGAVAAWLSDNFGVCSGADLEDAGLWASTALEIAATDQGLGAADKELLRTLLTQLSQPSSAGETGETVVESTSRREIEEPDSSDDIVDALEKMFPGHAKEAVLVPAAQWLRENFGVCSYADLEGAEAWAGTAIASASDLVGPGAEVLSELLHLLAGKPLVPVPDDSVLASLRKLFPKRRLDVLRTATEWLVANFGVSNYEDLQGAEAWASTAQEIADTDPTLGTARQAVKEILTRLEEGEKPKQAAVESAASDSALVQLQRMEQKLEPWMAETRVGKKLGAGSFGTVFEAELGGPWALKEISISKLRDNSHREQIQEEVRIHNSLRHEHILQCFDSAEVLGVVFVLLELCVGGELYDYMQSQQVLSEAEASRLWTQCVSAVTFLHGSGFMHRDIKPENVLLDQSRNAKLCDFGFVAPVPLTSLSATQECGSLAYMAPEMVTASGYDQRVDVWALGVLLHEMVAGHSLFASAFTELETRRKIANMEFSEEAWTHVPGGVQPLLKNLLRKEPDERRSLSEAVADTWVRQHGSV